MFAGFEWFIRRVGWPAFAFFWCPMMVALMWYTYHIRNASSLAVFWDFYGNGFFETLWQIYRPIWKGSPRAWAIVGTHALTQAILMRVLPGKKWEGPMTGSGHVPIYKANGVQAFVTTLLLFFTAVHVLELFNPAIVYDEWGNIFGGLTFFSFAFCLFLYFKGRYFPSSPDHSLSGNPIWDYYWGTELYPRILGWDVKVFTNCRFGMMGWAMMIICYAYKQHELGGLTDSMIVAVLLQVCANKYQSIASHRITSHHIASHHIASHPILPCNQSPTCHSLSLL
jgi:7-dehydrocholesterol reductase